MLTLIIAVLNLLENALVREEKRAERSIEGLSEAIEALEAETSKEANRSKVAHKLSSNLNKLLDV